MQTLFFWRGGEANTCLGTKIVTRSGMPLLGTYCSYEKSHLIKENMVVTECMPILRAAFLEHFLLLIVFRVSVVGSVALQIADGCRS